MGDGHNDDGADRRCRQAVDEAGGIASNAKLGKNPSAQDSANQTENNIGDAAEAASARKFSREPYGYQADHEPADDGMAHSNVILMDFRLQQRSEYRDEHEVSSERFREAGWLPNSSASSDAKEKRSASRGLLLGHAVNRAKSQDKIAAGDAHDLAPGKKSGQGVEGHAVVGVIKCRDEHEFVGNVEVGIARRQALIIEINRRGHGKRLDAKGPPGGVFHGFEQRKIFLKRDIVSVVRILLHDGHDGRGADEAREVVHMAVGIVASDAVLEPQNLRDAQIAAENVRVIFACETVVALLALAEQAFLGGEQGAAPVLIDAATLEHHATTMMHGLPNAALQFFVD